MLLRSDALVKVHLVEIGKTDLPTGFAEDSFRFFDGFGIKTGGHARHSRSRWTNGVMAGEVGAFVLLAWSAIDGGIYSLTISRDRTHSYLA